MRISVDLTVQELDEEGNLLHSSDADGLSEDSDDSWSESTDFVKKKGASRTKATGSIVFAIISWK